MTIIDTVKVLLVGGNNLSEELKKQYWEASFDGFPQAIISCDNTMFENCYDKVSESFTTERYKLVLVARQYMNLLKKYKNEKEFLYLCERQEGYFTGIGTIEKNEMSYAKAFKRLIANYNLLNNECSELEALAIVLRINIKTNDKEYKSSNKDVKLVVDDSLNFHDLSINIGA